MAGMSSDVEVLKDIPGYKAILKSVLKSQIQMLVEQLSEHTGEETILLTASVHDGTLSHQGSNTGRGFLEGRDEIKSQFLGYCLKSHHKKKVSETRSSPYQRPQSGIQGERTPSNQGPSKKVPRLQLQPQPVSLQRVVAGDSGLGPGLRPPDMQRAPSQVFDENRAESSAVSVKLESNDSSVTSSDLDNYSSATVTFSSSVQHDQSLTSGDVHSENNESQNSAEDSTERTSDNEDTSATSACIKIEPINENEMELEITGVEPGKVTTPTDSWSHTQSNFGAASTSGPVEPGTSDSIYNMNMLPRAARGRKKGCGPRVHTCPYCGEVFGQNTILVRHIRRHTGERPFPCPHCPMAFARKSSMLTHCFNKHPESFQGK
ncbi:hypothetical protein ACF0H5_019569 [Mactra antiquata]